jgi:hypothetical protein
VKVWVVRLKAAAIRTTHVVAENEQQARDMVIEASAEGFFDWKVGGRQKVVSVREMERER